MYFSAQICKTRWINIRDMMRRKIRERLRNPNRRSHRYKYEEELSFMLPYFKEPNTYTEEYPDLLDETDICDIGVSAEDFANSGDDFVNQDREIKPNISYKKRQDDSCSFNNDSYQELNPADPLDVFLITIGATLRKFSPYHLNQAKSKIFQVVQDYELEQIVNKDQEFSAK